MREETVEFQLLMLRVSDEPYCIGIDSVIEVISAVQPEEIIDQPPGLAGLINVRGEIIAVHDLRYSLGLPARPVEPTDRIVIGSDGGTKVGLLVDAVETVQNYKEEQLFAQALSPRAFKVLRIENRSFEQIELRQFLEQHDQDG